MTKTDTKLELTWVGKNNPEYDIANIEPRIIEEDESKSYGDPATGNMLIHGDNLLALKALLPEYEGKVKCIYIDPPYNANATGVPYDDNVEHSLWLGLINPRLELLRLLLSEEGVIIVHIDDNEQAYLKILMDTVFGRDNFINCISIRDSHPSGLKLAAKERKIIKTKSYMLVYKKTEKLAIQPIYQSRTDWDMHYSIYMDTKTLPLTKYSLKDKCVENGVLNDNESIHVGSLQNKRFRKFVFENRDKIFQSTKEMPDAARKLSIENIDTVISFENNGETIYAYNGRRLFPLTKSIQNTGIDGELNKEDFGKLLCDFWDDIDFNNSQNEGEVQFPASKKPEYLIARLLTMFTDKYHLVLDSFLGSGTTAAVAQKMGRRWIGIEMGNHAYTHCKVRLDKVIDGTDQGGISKAIDWKGGGGYKFYELAPSFITLDEFGNQVIDPYYNDAKLIKAMCKLMSYAYSPDREIYYHHGHGQGNNYIYVTTQLLTSSMVSHIATHLSENETLLITPTSFEPGADQIDQRITVKKIPQSILKSCHFGKKEYLLPIKEVIEKEEEVVDAE